ncbi:MAG: hypothetical protein ACKPKO_54590, partial [Candidatus Fonsibacter sp.]
EILQDINMTMSWVKGELQRGRLPMPCVHIPDLDAQAEARALGRRGIVLAGAPLDKIEAVGPCRRKPPALDGLGGQTPSSVAASPRS